MELIAKYDDSCVDIEGSAESLRELSRAIKNAAGSTKLPLVLPPTNPSPYLGFAKSLSIEVCDGNVCVSRNVDEITLAGSAEKLAILSRNIDRLAEQKSAETSGSYRDHLHVEYHPGHFYLKENSMPLVVTRQLAIAS